MMLNASGGTLRFTPPAPHLEWHVLLDTADPDAPHHPLAVPEVEVAGHSLVDAGRPADRRGRLAGRLDGGPQHGPRLLTALPPDPGTAPPTDGESST